MLNLRSGRRTFLQVGTLALGGFSLERMLQAAEVENAVLTGKSVVFLFMHGGPSQFETFDPKMDAPAEIRSATGEIQTRIPGVTFGSSFPKLAAMADRLSIVRSFQTGDGNHDIKPIVSRNSANANLGTLYSRVAGMNDPATGMPRNIALFPKAVRPESQAAVTQFGRFDSSGAYSSSLAPFAPGGDGNLQSDMTLNISQQRLDDRQSLLNQIDALQGLAEQEARLVQHSEFR
ncbi:MAG: DUF1501 domain-containing protein, partial [Planctomycetaceae bacterium]|nr:DUF1501 domain-containing protein [Planctomycetaceae bacterium]